MFRKTIVKLLVFLVLLYAAVSVAGNFMTPTWTTWNNNNTFKGIYDIPANRLQAVFVGTSSVTNGISPMELYKNYGICAYNLGSEQQPMAVSYYLAKEIYRRNPKTLKLVVVDLAFITKTTEEELRLKPFAEKALVRIRPSQVKLEAALDFAKFYESVDPLNYLFPVLSYHSRWSELTKEDFSYHNNFFTMGQNLEYTQSSGFLAPEKILMPPVDLTTAGKYSDETIRGIIGKQAFTYLSKTKVFCDEHGIQMLAVKIPKTWNNAKHFAAQYAADSLGIPFIDLNEHEYFEKMNFVPATDMTDASHCNGNGARKITSYLGSYIKENYDIPDIREDPEYRFMEKYAALYRQTEKDLELRKITDLSEYLPRMFSDQYFVVISAYDEAADGLDDEIREQIASLGLTNLSRMQEGESYLGIIDSGRVVLDAGTNESEKGFRAYGTYENGQVKLYDVQILEGTEDEPYMSTGSGYFQATSKGLNAGNASSVNIDGTGYSPQRRGLNFVVLRKDTEQVVSTCVFDTHKGTERLYRHDVIEEYLDLYESTYGVRLKP
ncbi:MAG: hypothetical protein IIY55_10225 [Blautia sp.]|nr:hypothetical protein [Blautia sp.]